MIFYITIFLYILILTGRWDIAITNPYLFVALCIGTFTRIIGYGINVHSGRVRYRFEL